MKGALVAGALAVMLSACAHRPEPAVPTVELPQSCAQRSVHVTFVGDSLARGWGASSPNTTFASLVYSEIRHAHPRTTMSNLGSPGATTDEIATKEVSRVRDGACAIVVVVAGANDVQKLYTPRHFGTSYTALLRNVRAHSPHAALVVIGLPDVSLSPRIPWVLKPVESWLSRDDNASIATAARTYGAAFVPLYALSHREAHRSRSLLSGDGIHPNDAGYRLMAAAAIPTIMALFQ